MQTKLLRASVLVFFALLWLDQLLWGAYGHRAVPFGDVALLLTLPVALLGFGPRALLAPLRSPIGAIAIAFAGCLLLSTLLHQHSISLRSTARMGIELWILCFFALVAARDRQWLVKTCTELAVLVVVVAALGAIAALLFDLSRLEALIHGPAFVVRDQHPLFGNWPRPTGGLSSRAETSGLWFLTATAILAAAADRRGGWLWLAAGVAALLAAATLTIMASGGLIFPAVWLWWKGRPKLASAALVLGLLGLALSQIPIHTSSVSRGLSPSNPVVADCLDYHPDHIARSFQPDQGSCHILFHKSGRALTRYGLAKQHAYALWKSAPLFGTGQRGFHNYALASRDAEGNPILWAYKPPHSTIAGAAAQRGLLGLLLLVALAVAVGQSLRSLRTTRDAAGLGLGLLLGGLAMATLSHDVLLIRLPWIALGVLVGMGRGRSQGRTQAGLSPRAARW